VADGRVELARTFFVGAPEDLAGALRSPEWVRAVTEALEPILAPGFEFVTVQDSVGMPGDRAGLEAFFSAYEAYAEMWETFRLEPVRFAEVGDHVVVEARISGVTRRGGVTLQQDVAAVYTFEGQKIRRIEEFSDRAAAYAAVRDLS
jgi:ketosteroid isomerase-like protein